MNAHITENRTCPNCGRSDRWWTDEPIEQGCEACDYWEEYDDAGVLVHCSDGSGALDTEDES